MWVVPVRVDGPAPVRGRCGLQLALNQRFTYMTCEHNIQRNDLHH